MSVGEIIVSEMIVDEMNATLHKDGARITVHLDMNKRTCSFTVNGTKYREISE
jgi:hypothetical protein